MDGGGREGWIRRADLAEGGGLSVPGGSNAVRYDVTGPRQEQIDSGRVVPGSLGNYGGIHKGVPVVTIELPNAMRTPLNAETRQMWLDLLRWTAAKIPGDVAAFR